MGKNHYRDQLDTRTINYLYNRGLTDKTIENYLIGTALSFNQEMRQLSKTKPKDTTIKNGNTYPFFSDSITFPIINVANNIKGYSARVFVDRGYGKYSNSRYLDKSKDMFGEHTIKGSKVSFLQEGQIDCCLINQNLKIPAVAPLGSAILESHIRRLKWLGVEFIIILGDNDKAGRSFNYKAMKYCEAVGIPCIIATLSDEYNDVGDIGIDLSWNHLSFINPYEWLFDQFDTIKDPILKQKWFDDKIKELSFKGATLDILYRIKGYELKPQDHIYQRLMMAILDEIDISEVEKEFGYWTRMLEPSLKNYVVKHKEFNEETLSENALNLLASYIPNNYTVA